MAADRNAELLGGMSLFHGLTPQQLSAVAKLGEKEFFGAGDAIIRNRSKSKAAYLILSGSVETRPTKKSGLEPEIFEAGALIGEMAMLTDSVALMDVVARERVRALAISREALYRLMDEDPEIALRLSETLTARLLNLAYDLRELDARFAALEASADETIAALSA